MTNFAPHPGTRCTANADRATRLAAVLLLSFLVWRGANSAWILATDHARHGLPSAASTDERLRNGLLFVSSRGADVTAHAHLKLLRQHVPERAKVYFLQAYRGAEDFDDVCRFLRLRELLYPRYTQPIDALPLPPSADEPPLGAKPTFVLDLRDPPDERHLVGFTLVATGERASLWRSDPR